MACTRCQQRRDQLSAAASAAARGNLRGAAQQVGAASRSLAQDARATALRLQAASRLATIRKGR